MNDESSEVKLARIECKLDSALDTLHECKTIISDHSKEIEILKMARAKLIGWAIGAAGAGGFGAGFLQHLFK
jgi:hypothetical protein